MTSKGWKTLKRKRRRTCRHGVRRIWKLYSKGRPASKLTWCEPSGDHLDYRWRENIQRTSPQITGRAKAVTMLRLEKCVFRHTLGARTFYTSPLRKCQKTQRKTFWLAIFRLLNIKWIMKNILSFTKGIFNNLRNLGEKKSERTFETPCSPSVDCSSNIDGNLSNLFLFRAKCEQQDTERRMRVELDRWECRHFLIDIGACSTHN